MSSIKNQRKLAERYAEDVDGYSAPGPWCLDEDYKSYEIHSNKVRNQVDVYTEDGDGLLYFAVTLAVSKELKDEKYEKGSDEYNDRINELCREFHANESEPIKKYGSDYFLTYDDSITDPGYIFSVTGDVPDGYKSELDYIDFS